MRTHRVCNLSMTAHLGEVLGEQMTWLKLFVESKTTSAQGAEGREQENKSVVTADRKDPGVLK